MVRRLLSVKLLTLLELRSASTDPVGPPSLPVHRVIDADFLGLLGLGSGDPLRLAARRGSIACLAQGAKRALPGRLPHGGDSRLARRPRLPSIVPP